jgi:hypothetical protein
MLQSSQRPQRIQSHVAIIAAVMLNSAAEKTIAVPNSISNQLSQSLPNRLQERREAIEAIERANQEKL